MSLAFLGERCELTEIEWKKKKKKYNKRVQYKEKKMKKLQMHVQSKVKFEHKKAILKTLNVQLKFCMLAGKGTA